MTLNPVVNGIRAQKKYEAHVLLDPEFAPIMKRGVQLHLQCSSKEFPAKRLLGCKNIDLWIDGSLYPVDPISDISLWFRNLKGFVEFCCHGENGLLGYSKSLRNASAVEVEKLQRSFMSDRIMR